VNVLLRREDAEVVHDRLRLGSSHCRSTTDERYEAMVGIGLGEQVRRLAGEEFRGSLAPVSSRHEVAQAGEDDPVHW
jgi:hypothetical protein